MKHLYRHEYKYQSLFYFERIFNFFFTKPIEYRLLQFPSYLDIQYTQMYVGTPTRVATCLESSIILLFRCVSTRVDELWAYGGKGFNFRVR